MALFRGLYSLPRVCARVYTATQVCRDHWVGVNPPVTIKTPSTRPCPKTIGLSTNKGIVLKTPFSTNAEVLEKVVDELDERKQQQHKLFAVIHISGRQFKVTPNDLIVVNQIEADIGDEIYLDKVLLAGSEDVTLIGRPLLSEELIRIKATVTEHTKTAKVIVFKKKRRKNYKRKKGHRQPVSVLRINSIDINTNSKLN